ncbi:helix-turn-helix transcriptional regulator [Cellulomonas sp. S1-8]|uniref:helix-turn-helix transcriptional regulator n=1 Tax=Cellulomonas sp. S1-8 TaxID=2904790 RepID=UPI002244124C|nr:helix-turn-helix transcriptional regulator [Cellulomonas sp. S1-8]UZN03130.1 helix-turn-helix transcriptional regulator [Cellulomonas sp. S1-8]
MTTTPTGGYRVRIAISSPEIEARIRGVFASRGLDVVLEDSLPTFEVTVLPGAGAPPGPSALGDALHHLVGTVRPRRTTPPSARYRLTLATAAAAPTAADATRRHGNGEPRRTGDGVADLSPRESQVMACIARGLRNTEVAAELGVTEKTVKNHVNRIFSKLGADGRVEAVLIWQSARTRTAPGAQVAPRTRVSPGTRVAPGARVVRAARDVALAG